MLPAAGAGLDVNMHSRKIHQTTVVHLLRPEFSFSSVFIGTADPARQNIAAIMAALGIESLSGGDISRDELRKVIVYMLSDNLEVFDFADPILLRYVNELGIMQEFLDEIMTTNCLMIDGENPRALSVTELLDGSIGAELGTLALTSRSSIEDEPEAERATLLVMLGRSGIVICGGERAVFKAMAHGLYDRIHRSMVGVGPAAGLQI